MSEPTLVHLFTDYACPWCYLGRARLKRVSAPIRVQTVHFPLAPDTPPEGRDLRAYLQAKGYDVDAATARLAALMEAEGLPWSTSPDRRAWPTRKAQELAAWAEPQVGEAIHDALFAAYQVHNANVGDVEVLVGIAAGLGLDPAEARRVLTEGALRAAVDRDWAEARRIGVTSVPTYVARGRGVVGAQPVEVLDRLIAG